MSVLAERPPSPLLVDRAIVQHTARAEIDVIDVDSLDDDDITFTGSRQTLQMPADGVIDLTAEDASQPSSSSRSVAGSSTSGRSRLFSPPPPIQAPEVIPPVPPIPRFAQQNRNRRYVGRHPDEVPGVVRAEVTPPFTFEMNFRTSPPPQAPVPHPRRVQSPPMRLAPPPQLGLGGAVVTSNAARPVRRPRHRTSVFSVGNFVDRNWLSLVYGMTHDRTPEAGRTMTFFTPVDFDAREAVDPDYKQGYTHPDPVEAGFTFDFAPQTDSSKEQPIVIDLETESQPKEPVEEPAPTLACAHCDAPLVLGGGAAQDEDDARANRVWALRCGHVIDGRCLDKLSIPLPVLGEETKGSKRKGKGRAKPTVALPEETFSYADYLPGSIRSRLRSSNSTSGASTSSIVGSLVKLKRGRPAKKRKIQEEHPWKCPVVSCGREHKSVKIDGAWAPETERGEGAVGLFV